MTKDGIVGKNEDRGKTPEEDEAETMQDSTSPSLMDVPEEWRSLPLQEMVDEGWKPRTKTTRNQLYLTLRKGQHERSLGQYSEDKWNLLMEMFPKLKEVSEEPPHVDVGNVSQKPSKATSTGGLLGGRLKKPEALGTAIGLSLETLNWYEHLRLKGYDKSIGDFLSDVVHLYFKEQGLRPAIIIQSTDDGN